MKVKVLKRFRDKTTGELYEAGSEIDLTEKRVNEVAAALPGFIKVIAKPAEADPPAQEPTPDAAGQDPEAGAGAPGQDGPKPKPKAAKQPATKT